MINEGTGRNVYDDADEDDDILSSDESVDDDPGDTVVLSDTDYTDNVGDISVEINVEELVAKFEATDASDIARRKEIRRRLEELQEEKNFEDTYAIDFDAD